MKVAWVTYDFEEYSVQQVNAMSGQHEVLLVMPPCESDQYQVEPQVEHYAFHKPRLRQPIKQWQSVKSILRRIDDFRPDVVHFQQGHMWFNAALRSLKKYPLVITIHDPRHHAGDVVSRKTPQWLMDFGFRQADHVIVHGEPLARQVRELFGFREDHVHVIPHVAMGQTRDDVEVEEDPNLVLFFGRIWDYKGLDQLIAAEPILNQDVPSARVMIAGEGEDFARYRTQMKNPDHFIVHNRWVSDEERAHLFRRAAVVVLPYNEATQSGVVPVAYNYAKPVVATDVGALAECVEHEVTGLLVPPREPEQLARSLARLLRDERQRHQLGKAGKQRQDAESSPGVVAERTVRVYEQACRLPTNPVQLENGPQDSDEMLTAHATVGGYSYSEEGH
ncbi:MAG: glycosyltransferase family 4 protein [Aureliella sp.]